MKFTIYRILGCGIRENKTYNYTTPENIFLKRIDYYQTHYLLEKEKLGILKSLTPISLIPLLAGFLLEGQAIIINWNWYTVIFFGTLSWYFYSLRKNYNNIKLWKYKEIKIKDELRRVQNKQMDNSSKNKNLNHKFQTDFMEKE